MTNFIGSKITCAALGALMICLFSAPAVQAQNIQMLPPTTTGTTGVCPGGGDQVLFYSGNTGPGSAINCNPNFNFNEGTSTLSTTQLSLGGTLLTNNQANLLN